MDAQLWTAHLSELHCYVLQAEVQVEALARSALQALTVGTHLLLFRVRSFQLALRVSQPLLGLCQLLLRSAELSDTIEVPLDQQASATFAVSSFSLVPSRVISARTLAHAGSFHHTNPSLQIAQLRASWG